MKTNSVKLEKKLKLKFNDQKLFLKSLTHKSFDSINNFEKIEFLGDRVLGLIIAKKLLELYPEEKEGILDKKFASLVNKKKCLEVAKFLELEKNRIESWKGYQTVGTGYTICQRNLPLNFKNLEQRIFEELNRLRQLEPNIEKILNTIS